MTTHQGRLLILDDDPAIGRTIGLVAEGIGFEARAVSRPAPFLRELDIWAPTHIALDLIMHEMDGVEGVRLLAGRQCRPAGKIGKANVCIPVTNAEHACPLLTAKQNST